ncbi:MAG: hypothetical protein NXI31_10850 [bacterium]|nr:hypothetical protein [bacterium]
MKRAASLRRLQCTLEGASGQAGPFAEEPQPQDQAAAFVHLAVHEARHEQRPRSEPEPAYGCRQANHATVSAVALPSGSERLRVDLERAAELATSAQFRVAAAD